MGDLIRFKRGLKANLPTLEVGEFAYCTDTKEVFIGTSTGNQNIISSRLANFQNYFDQVKEVQDQDIQQDIRFNKLVEDYYNMFGGNGLLTQEITTETANLSKRATKNAPMKVAGFGKTEGKNKVAYVNKTIDDPIAELNGHTLREVFEGGNIIEDNEFKSLSNWNLVRATPTLLDDGVKLNVISTLSTEYGYIWQNILSDIIPNNNYYHWVELTTLSPEYYGSTLMQYTNLGNVPQGNNIPYQSGRYKISFEANSLTGTYTIAHFRMHLSNGSGGDIILHNIGMINKNALGITSLTKEQIDYYYSLYVARKNITKKLLTYADIFEEKNLMTNYDILRVGNNSTYYMSITANGIQWNNNQKYYRYIEVKNNFNSSEYKTTYYASTIDVGFRNLGGLLTPTENEYHKFSDIYTWVYNSQYTPFRIYSETFDGTNLQSNDELHIRNWELISFEHFDELITKEQLDTMLDYYLEHQDYEMADMINPTVEAVGKNLIDQAKIFSNFTFDGEYYTQEAGSKNTSQFYLKSGTYRFSLYGQATSPATSYGIEFRDSANNIVKTYYVGTMLQRYNTDVVISTSGYYYIKIIMGVSGAIAKLKEIQLEQGTTATTYEPYQKSKKTYLGAFRKLDETTYDEFNEEQKTTRVGYVESIDDELVGYNGKTLRDVFGDSSNVQSVGKNLFDKSRVTVGYYIASNGSLNASSAVSTSDYTSVKPSTSYIKTSLGGSTIVYYDIDKNYISYVASNTTFTTPSNCFYVRFSLNTVSLDTQQLEQGTTATAYEQYIDIDILLNDWSLYYEGVLKHLYDPDDIFGTNEPTLEEFESLLHAYELLQAGESSARYLLPEPIVEPIQTSGDTHLLSYPNSFITQTSLLTNLEKYTTQITFSYPIEKLNKLIILNGDGTQTNLDTSLATIAIDNLSLTHPDLTLNDFIYYEATVKDSLNYTDLNFTFYKDSKVVVDSVTSDLIKWHVKASNGVLSLEGDIV